MLLANKPIHFESFPVFGKSEEVTPLPREHPDFEQTFYTTPCKGAATQTKPTFVGFVLISPRLLVCGLFA